MRGKFKSSRSSDHQPTQKVSISINGTRLTGQYDECLRYHVNGYHLRTYIQRKRQWSDTVWDDVDFELFSKHFRGLRHSHQIQHMKFVHDQLPLGWRHQKYSESSAEQLALCPCCLETAESNEHFMRCQKNDARTSGINLILSDKAEKSPHLCRRLAVEGIKFWHTTGTNDFRPTLKSFPRHMWKVISNVVRQQSNIGWDNLLKGYLSKAWTDLAAFDNIDEQEFDVPRAHTRLKRLVKDIHSYTRNMWLFRNEKLHSHKNTAAETVWSTTQAEIKHFYFKRELVSFEDQHLFRFSLDQLLRSSRSTQTRWLRRAKASAKRKRVESNSQTLITRYFKTVTQET